MSFQIPTHEPLKERKRFQDPDNMKFPQIDICATHQTIRLPHNQEVEDVSLEMIVIFLHQALAITVRKLALRDSQSSRWHLRVQLQQRVELKFRDLATTT